MRVLRSWREGAETEVSGNRQDETRLLSMSMKRCGWPSRAESSLRSALVPEARSQRRRGLACVVVVLVLEICYKWWDARHLKIQCPLSETSSSASVRAGAGRRHVRTILQLPSVVQHADVLHSRCRYRCRCTTRTAGILHAVSVWAHVAYRNNGNTARISCKYVLTWFFSNLLELNSYAERMKR